MKIIMIRRWERAETIIAKIKNDSVLNKDELQLIVMILQQYSSAAQRIKEQRKNEKYCIRGGK